MHITHQHLLQYEVGNIQFESSRWISHQNQNWENSQRHVKTYTYKTSRKTIQRSNQHWTSEMLPGISSVHSDELWPNDESLLGSVVARQSLTSFHNNGIFKMKTMSNAKRGSRPLLTSRCCNGYFAVTRWYKTWAFPYFLGWNLYINLLQVPLEISCTTLPVALVGTWMSRFEPVAK